MTPFPGRSRRPPAPRVTLGTRAQIGPLNTLMCAIISRFAGMGAGSPPAVFTTLARHRRLFRAWLRFAAHLMPGGALTRRDTELVILRVSVTCRSDYEWGHHVLLGRGAGLSDEQIARVGAGPDAPGWDDHERALLRAADELVGDHVVSDETWARLRRRYDERLLIELCLLAGHYAMLAGALNSLGVRPDRAAGT